MDAVTGEPFRYVAGTQSSSGSNEPPEFGFSYGCIHVVAKAVEEYPDVYETLNEYGRVHTAAYRMFKMQVMDPLDSKLEGEFFYLLPKHLAGDLTQYDALLMSMTQLPANFVLRSGNRLTAFEYLFTDPNGHPELGNIIAFSKGVFDEALWKDRSWLYGYQFGKYMLDREDEELLVFRGSTLAQALERRKAQMEAWGTWGKPAEVEHYAYETDAAKTVMAYIKPFENGVFVPARYTNQYRCRRYINGCPTNEWVQIDSQTEKVTTSEYQFTEDDLEGLPNIPQYIANLALSEILPQHTQTEGKKLIYQSAVGWYEKTQNGVCSVVIIAWRYFDEKDRFTEYYDETFIILDTAGDRVVSREELRELIGENQNIYYGQYGVGVERPME